jgi:hypothetical protein
MMNWTYSSDGESRKDAEFGREPTWKSATGMVKKIRR